MLDKKTKINKKNKKEEEKGKDKRGGRVGGY